MKKLPIILIVFLVLIIPNALAYSFDFLDGSEIPQDGRTFYNSACYTQRVSENVALTPDYCLPQWLGGACFPLSKTVTPVIYFAELSDPYTTYSLPAVEMTPYATEIIRRDFTVCGGNDYKWYVCIEESGENPVCSINKFFSVEVPTQPVNPPTAQGLRSCLTSDYSSPSAMCYGSGATFDYDVNRIYPAWNMTIGTTTGRICVYASSTVRGSFYSNCKTLTLGTPNVVRPYSHDSISTVPGETITWYATIDDFTNVPITTTSSVVAHIAGSPNAAPIITLTDADGDTYTYPTPNVWGRATVTDSDSPQTALTVKFYLKKPSSSNYNLICTKSTQASSDYDCSFNTDEAGRYRWRVTAVDEVESNLVTENSYFDIEAPNIDNVPPQIELLTTNPSGDIPLDTSVSFTVRGTDADNDNVWFSWYCQYDADLSPDQFDGQPYASSPDPYWAGHPGGFAQPKEYTITCPDDTKQTPQWNETGTYLVLMCVTDGPLESGKEGFSSYNRCVSKEIRITEETYFDPILRNQSIEFATCLAGEGCILNEFYRGMVLFVSHWFVYFLWILIAAVIFFVAYYVYVKVREGMI